jgi:2-polyprenyl-6-methoxyphenol hydroxylase-like FAD-dependent oxidoreductase
MTTQDSNLPILIIGAGIGGLSTALALQQAGFTVRVFERTKQVREVGAGLTLWPNAVRVLLDLGQTDLVQRLALPETTRSGFYTAHGKPLALFPPQATEKHLGGATVVTHRAEFQAALRDQVQPGTICLDKQFVSFEQDETGVTACFADGERVHGSLLIGADGIHSRVRQQLFPQSQPRYAGYTAWRGIATGVHSPIMGELWGRGMRFGIVPLTQGRVYWFATRNTPENAAENPQGRQKELLELFQGWHPSTISLIEATEASTILRNDIYDLQPLSTWSKGRVTLLGDAAHATTPNMGQGACQALEDAWVLAETLRRSQLGAQALLSYQQKRLVRANMVVTRSRQIGMVAQWENPLVCWLRDRLMMLTPPHLLGKQMESVTKEPSRRAYQRQS